MATELVLALLFGTPVLALALAVAYHAQLYLMDRRGKLAAPASDAEAREQLDAAPEMVLDLRRSIEELQDQLAKQRHTLYGLLSETAQRDARRELGAEPLASAPAAPRATSPPATAPFDVAAAPRELPDAVRQLAAEGLSDRAIARRLRIGLEEVRLLSRRHPEPAS
jgi:hypothetical protein